MILDHGIDSANAWLCVMPLACICQFGEWWSVYFIWSVNVAYNMQLLELEYTKQFNIGLISGPAEGLIWCCLSAISQQFLGCGYYANVPHRWGYTMHQIMIYPYCVICSVTILLNIYKIYRESRNRNLSILKNAALFLWPVFFFYVNLNVYLYSKARITKEVPHLFFFFVGCCHSSVMIKMLIKHYGKERY